ncbi:penicillin acylase family protein [Luteimonas huabeiensis]|uniref:penicillin acylase family protein n=1 Tax=Luteimonas huabeiensis TaxID=1244513 RepID=UPI000464BFC4|nr:penicillin acylase family protein [Luteimonas huabeiensis]
MRSRTGRLLGRLALLLAVLALAAAALAWWLLRGSLPRLDGEFALPGLSAPATVQRDALGVVTVEAASETDAFRALGYVHAQERYFEMDLMRRVAAGELAALFGERALETDRRNRAHRMRARVEASLAEIAGDRLAQLEAYADGANAGLAALRVRPWPYLLLGRAPEPWTAADAALTGYAMYFDLQDADNAQELARGRMRPHLPPALFALLAHDGSSWDAPLFGGPRGDAVLPDASAVDLRTLPAPPAREAAPGLAPSGSEPGGSGGLAALVAAGTGTDLRPGSNNFAVSGALTADGRALVADDMHLGLRAPGIWFRARLRYPHPRAPGGRVDVSGFTLPGLPAVVVGSNTRVAWGFTNSYGDFLDWRRVRPCEASSPASGCVPVVRHVERIAVAGGTDETLTVEETAWGPLLHREADGTALALRWVAHLPGSLNFGLADFALARDLDDALAIADRTATPTQNLVLGDREGRIAWRLLGPIPVREAGCGGFLPLDATAPCAPWPIATDASPLLRSPAADRLWTANSRVVDGADYARIGDGGAALGARARQIRDALAARERFAERDLLDIQLDDRALLMTRWWTLLRETAARPVAPGDAGSPALHALAEAARDWSGRAEPGSVAYRIVRAWRLAVHARIADGLTAPARAALGPDFVAPDWPNLEGVVWPLVQRRPAHLLPRRYACAEREDAPARCRDDAHGWAALFEDAATEVRAELEALGPLRERTWGERNTAAICHPLAGAIPLLGRRLLCMPPDPLPGDGMMPRVQGPAFGASQRMVVAPGHEAEGIAHMPGGQSGHPLSPFWGAGHADWVQGRPAPFLPGEAAHRLRLTPAP